jgi:uncharacterized protein YbjT (DUF2867 family)
MSGPILVAGGTGMVGRVVVGQLVNAGAEVRVLSRGRRRRYSAVEHFTGNLRTGEGLGAALAEVNTVVLCADPAYHIVEAAKRACAGHLVYISIVGVDRVPLCYYRSKLADEHVIAESGLGWTVLRTTQFHDLIALMMEVLAKPPIMALPAGWSVQPVDSGEVGARLAQLALAEPVGLAPAFGGPQVRPVKDLAGIYLSMVGKRRPILPVSLPGKVFRAYRAGGHLAPENTAGKVTFEDYITSQSRAGRHAYDDALHDYLHRRSKKSQ